MTQAETLARPQVALDRRFARRLWGLLRLYWVSPDARGGALLLAGAVALELLTVYANVRIADGHCDLNRTLSLSPNGGLIGEAYIHGMNLVTEAVRQIRGTASNQVANVENVLISAGMSGAILSKT